MAPLLSRSTTAALAALLAVAGASSTALRGGGGGGGGGGADPNTTSPASSEPAPSPGRWPPRNWCAQFETEDECASGADETCQWSCWTSSDSGSGGGFGSPGYDTARCWPKAEGWGCAYNGGGKYCAPEGEWDCAVRWGDFLSDNGCHCWYSYRGALDCCPCPPVPHCAGREFVSCGGAAAGGSIDHLVASTCSRCEEGFEPSEDQTECLTIGSTSGPTTSPGNASGDGDHEGNDGDDDDDKSTDVCDVGYGERVDCGFYSITEEECLERECCWGAVPEPNVDNIAWCYKRSDVPPPPSRDECRAEPMEERVDCGAWGMSEVDCLSLGCCWAGGPSPNPLGYPWCFHPSNEGNSSVDDDEGAADDDSDTESDDDVDDTTTDDVDDATDGEDIEEGAGETGMANHSEDSVSEEEEEEDEDDDGANDTAGSEGSEPEDHDSDEGQASKFEEESEGEDSGKSSATQGQKGSSGSGDVDEDGGSSDGKDASVGPSFP